MSPIRRTRHAVYDLKYYLVWVPKYRKLVLKDGLAKRLKEVFQEIAERYEFEIDTMEVKEDHVDLFFDSASSVFSVPNSADYEEYIGQGSVQGVSGN